MNVPGPVFRVIKSSDIARCPDLRMDPAHYREDGTCLHLPDPEPKKLCGCDWHSGVPGAEPSDCYQDNPEDEPDGAPCCMDPGCPGRYGNDCTFPGYAANH